MQRVLIPQLSATPRVPSAAVQTLHGETMGTTWSIKLAGLPADVALADVQRSVEAELDTVISQMSTWEPASTLCAFNRAPARTWHTLPPEFFSVLQCALEVARLSNGAYDPTVGRMVTRWGFGPEPPTHTALPESEVTLLRSEPRWYSIALGVNARAAYQPGGATLDLSAIAKGFAVDQVTRTLETLGVESSLVEIGGELRGRGIKPDGTPWWVSLEAPPNVDGAHDAPEPTLVALHDLSAATSGDYRRYFYENGSRYSHTLDPRAGEPIDNGVASVTVLHSSCMLADAYSTALTVLGPTQGMSLASRLNLAALFICRTATGFEEHLSPSLREMLE